MKTSTALLAGLAGLGALFWWKKSSATSVPKAPANPYAGFVSVTTLPDGKSAQIFDNQSLKPAFQALLQSKVSEGTLQGFPLALLNNPANGRTLQAWLDANGGKSPDIAILLSTNAFVPSAAEVKTMLVVPSLPKATPAQVTQIEALVAPGARYAAVS